MRLLFVAPPTKTSNEIDTVRRIPSVELRVVGDPAFGEVDHALSSRRLPVLGSPERWTAALAWLRGLDTVDVGDIDAVLTTELFSPVSVQAGRFARRIGVPHVVVVQDILDSNPLYWVPPWRSFVRANTRGLSGAVCWTEPGRDFVERRGVAPERVVVVPPGIDTSHFRPATQRPTDPTLVFVGELREDKGILDVIAAADLIAPDMGPSFRLIVVGDGGLRARVDNAAMSRPWLDVRGRVPRQDLPALLQSASAFVIGSYSRRLWVEQFGFAVVEAMACGLPIVATTCGALPEIVPGHNALVAERDVSAMANGLRAALGPEGSEWGRLNRERACDGYDVHRQGEALGDGITRLLRDQTQVRPRRDVGKPRS